MFSIEKANANDPQLKEVFDSGRPLFSTLLNREELGIKSDTRHIEQYYARAEELSEIQSLADKIKEEQAEALQIWPGDKSLSFRTLVEAQNFERDLKKFKRSKAAKALQAGLGKVLSDILEHLQNPQDSSLTLESFLEGVKDSADMEDAAGFLRSLGADQFSQNPKLYAALMQWTRKNCQVKTRKNEKSERSLDDSKYKSFFDYSESFQSLARPENAYRYLSLRRGVGQGDLLMEFELPQDELVQFLSTLLAPVEKRKDIGPEMVDWAIQVSQDFAELFAKNIAPKELLSDLRARSEQPVLPKIQANLERVFMAPGINRKTVLSIAPAGKQSCRAAVIDREGELLESCQIPLLEGEKKSETEAVFLALIQKHEVQALAITQLPGAREIERSLRELFRSVKIMVPLTLVAADASEDYASSKLGQEEHPDLDSPTRKAIFTARQLQNPIRELVKVKVNSLGVGQFLNEVHPDSLQKAWMQVLRKCVHNVGVDLNSCSPKFLSFVDGISDEVAKAVVAFRKDKGFFWSREQVLEVEGMTPELFEYCGPFLRVQDGKLKSDTTFLHPKHNDDILDAFKKLKVEHSAFIEKADLLLKSEKLKEKLGEKKLKDFVEALKTGGKDPRGEYEFVQFRDDINKLSDLKVGMVCPGRVSNVTDFGAFVDIGLSQDGLVHLSELASTYVRDPYDVIQPGEVVTVKVLTLNVEKKQISFSMKGVSSSTGRNSEIEKRNQEAQKRRGTRTAAGDASKGPSPRRNKGVPRKSDRRSAGGPKGSERSGKNNNRSPGKGRSSNSGGLRDNPFAALADLKGQLRK